MYMNISVRKLVFAWWMLAPVAGVTSTLMICAGKYTLNIAGAIEAIDDGLN